MSKELNIIRQDFESYLQMLSRRQNKTGRIFHNNIALTGLDSEEQGKMIQEITEKYKSQGLANDAEPIVLDFADFDIGNSDQILKSLTKRLENIKKGQLLIIKGVSYDSKPQSNSTSNMRMRAHFDSIYNSFSGNDSTNNKDEEKTRILSHILKEATNLEAPTVLFGKGETIDHIMSNGIVPHSYIAKIIKKAENDNTKKAEIISEKLAKEGIKIDQAGQKRIESLLIDSSSWDKIYKDPEVLNNFADELAKIYWSNHSDNNEVMSVDEIPKGIQNLFKYINKNDLGVLLAEVNYDGTDIEELVDLAPVKKALADINRSSKVNKKLGVVDDDNISIVLTGNPGCGKTMLAPYISNSLFRSGKIEEDKIFRLTGQQIASNDNSDFVEDVIRVSKKGLLFIDEVQGALGSKDGIMRLLKILELSPCSVMVGYPGVMKDLIKADPGFQSRMPYIVNIKDYNAEQLYAIFNKRMKKYNKHFIVTSRARQKLINIFNIAKLFPDFGNGRFAKAYAQQVQLQHSLNVKPIAHNKGCYTITEDDITTRLLKQVASLDNIAKRIADVSSKTEVVQGLLTIASTLYSGKVLASAGIQTSTDNAHKNKAIDALGKAGAIAGVVIGATQLANGVLNLVGAKK